MEKVLNLPKPLLEKYREYKPAIQKRLGEFSEVQRKDWFYELCFCICTPQSRAENAFAVEIELREKDFKHNDLNLVSALGNKERYIRFHNQKAKNLEKMKSMFYEIETLLESKNTPEFKRFWLAENVRGIGMKESSHFLRNIGYINLAILDRHILKHLTFCGLFESVPVLKSAKHYLEIERRFLDFANHVNIPLDELDLLFWSYETGAILK